MANRNTSLVVNHKYPVQVWLTTMLVGALLFITTFRSYDPTLICLTLFMSMMYSIPALGIHFLAFYLLAEVPASAWFVKLLMAMVAIACTFVTFQMIEFPFPKHFWDRSIYLCYTIAILPGSFLFRLRKSKKAPRQAKSL